MKSFDELMNLAKEYVSKKEKKEDVILYNPVFRLEDEQLYLAYMVVDFMKKDGEYYIKRPTKWLLQDMVTGVIAHYYDIQEKDFSNLRDLPLDTIYFANNYSPLFQYNNFVIHSFGNWEQKALKDLKSKMEQETNPLYKKNVLKIEDSIISPQDYILANIEDGFAKMMDILRNEIGGSINEAFEEYARSLLENIRQTYVSLKKIDIDLIKEYMNYLKYAWPESWNLFNQCTNIKETIDSTYDEFIQDLLHKREESERNEIAE